MEKTLYLSESPTLRVRRDGPSLWIEHKGQAGQRVPARLIRRVLIKGNVALDSGSLTLFAERGIPITFLNRQGATVAAMLGVDEHDRYRRIRQERAGADRDMQDRLQAWLAAWARGRELKLVARLGLPCETRWRRDGYRRTDYQQMMLSLVPQPLRWQPLHRFLSGALYELVLTHITTEGWDPHLGIRRRDQPFGLVWDVVETLHAEVDGMWLAVIQARQTSSCSPQRHAVEVFEAAQDRLDKFLRLMLSQYARMLLEP